uniref:Putative tick transposon n=1 Tax=Rhipicephalus microplus TaxID=6941 RepID=A0A6M2D2Y0_RHIMP
MTGLAGKLKDIAGLQHAIYADNITVRTTTGSLAEKEDRLQQAASTIEKYARIRGLQCSAEKSEFIRFTKRKARSIDPNLKLEVKLDGNVIPEKDTVRILRMWLQANQRCLHKLNQLKTSVQQISRMISRITNNRKGMREQDTLKLVKSLVISRITYSLPYQIMNREEKEKANQIIVMAYKTALRLPQITSNDKLLALDLHNTIEELSEAKLLVQENRLLQTPTGRAVLTKLGRDTLLQTHQETKEVPSELREWYTVLPIPEER